MDAAEDTRPMLPQHTKRAAWALFLLFIYSVAMFTLPFVAFYGTKYTLLDRLEISGFTNTVWSVIASVITIYLIIFSYAYRAYYEKEYDDDGNEIFPSSSNEATVHQSEHPKAD